MTVQLPGTLPTKRRRVELMFAELDQIRQSFVAHWRELTDFIKPRRGRFDKSDVNRGDKRTKSIIDSTASFAARTLASGMHSGITSPARPWFRLTTSDYAIGELSDVRAYLDEVGDRMRKVLLRSNWYNVLPICYGDLGTFGTHAMLMAEDDEEVVRFYPFPIGSYCLGNNARGQARYFAREFQMTVGQIVERFAQRDETGAIIWTNISPTVRDNFERGQLQAQIYVVHAVTPNPEHNPRKLESKHKRFYACYYERGQANTETALDVFLEEKGFDEYPILAPRWEVTGEDVFATDCPGMMALGDIKQLQHGEKKGAKGLDKSIDPPMVGPVALSKSKASLLPGDVTYVQENQHSTFRPAHEVTIRLDLLEMKQAQVRTRIEKAYFTDLFLMLAYMDQQRGGKSPVTATEIAERHDEKLLALGPVLEQLNQDLLSLCIVRLYNIMQRRGMLPDPPESLQGQDYDIEYTSIMAQAQKLVGLGAIERFAGFIGNLAVTDPSAWDKVDRDQMIDEYADATGVAGRLVLPDEKVAAIRDARAKAAQAQHEAELVAQGASAARDLSQSDTTQKNALTDILGAGAPVPGGQG